MMVDAEALAFFNGLSGTLEVELTENAEPIPALPGNLVALPTAGLIDVTLTIEIFENDVLRELTNEEWDRVVFRAPLIRLRGLADNVVAHPAPNGRSFTVRELAKAIEETERQGRGSTHWLGGIDVHHIYFEGLTRGKDGVWEIGWGS